MKNSKFQIGDLVKMPVVSGWRYGIVIGIGIRPDITVRIFGLNGNKCWYHPDSVKLIAKVQ